MTKYLALAFYRLYAGATPYKEGVAECRQGDRTRRIPYKVYHVSRLIPRWAAAQTWGNYVFLCKNAPESVLPHEEVHVCQFARHAPFFPLFYFLAWLRWGYYNNPFEREARENGVHQ